LAKKIDNFGLLSEKINEAEAVLFATNNSTNSESVSDMLQSAINSLSSVSSVDEKLTNIVDTLNNVFYTVDDLKEQLSSFIATLEYNPALFEKTHRRLDELATVTRLFDGTVEGVLEAKDTLSEEYDVIVNTDDRLAQLDAELDTTFKSMQKLASELSGLRKESAIKLAEKINEELEGLSMQSVEFAIDINSSDATFKPNGIDDVMFTISPYKNADFVPINKAASGGELSRIMLAIELVLHEKSKDASKTLVFDEVDSGLGGGVAKQVGMRLRRLAESVQVIVITHLPQVASFAQEQITLEKTQEENGAFAIAHNVYENERLSEIARMLSGSVNETSLNHAKELLTDSQKY
jgi:DNA repair protein RecN (Recombination protein N)